MNILYTSYMFHTNQVPIVKGMIEKGHHITFVCQSKGANENHEFFKPMVLGHSSLFCFINKIYRSVWRKKIEKSSFPEKFEGYFGFPPIIKFAKLLSEINPDIVIVRERIMYSVVCYLICKYKKINCCLYNQNPIWREKPEKNDILHKMVRLCTPEYRMTPVLGKDKHGELDAKAFYIPFVIEKHISPREKRYFKNGKINILCVGKFEERKNQLMLLMIFKEIYKEYNCTLTLVGEVSTSYHRECYDKVKQFVEKNNLKEDVFLFSNCKPQNMDNFYKDADLFVLPSTGEFASVSQLEAMSYSIPVIVSNTNGTGCYIAQAKNGYLFEDNNKEDLSKKIEKIIVSRENIIEMGSKSYALVEEEYNIEQYEKKIKQLIRVCSK